jgi:hypothetical protein
MFLKHAVEFFDPEGDVEADETELETAVLTLLGPEE